MSSKRSLRRRSCAGKERFDARPAEWGGMFAYACRFCGGWHLGHPSRRLRQSRSAKARFRRKDK